MIFWSLLNYVVKFYVLFSIFDHNEGYMCDTNID